MKWGGEGVHGLLVGSVTTLDAPTWKYKIVSTDKLYLGRLEKKLDF